MSPRSKRPGVASGLLYHYLQIYHYFQSKVAVWSALFERSADLVTAAFAETAAVLYPLADAGRVLRTNPERRASNQRYALAPDASQAAAEPEPEAAP